MRKSIDFYIIYSIIKFYLFKCRSALPSRHYSVISYCQALQDLNHSVTNEIHLPLEFKISGDIIIKDLINFFWEDEH